MGVLRPLFSHAKHSHVFGLPALNPANSPADALMPCAGVEGFMRPGCVHVTLQATVAASAVASDGGAHNLRNAIAHLLERELPIHRLMCCSQVPAWQQVP